jgi:hypothetical protein
MKRVANYLTLALPIIGLGGLWGWSDFKSEQGTDWLVPIAGYDPRDLLRGHYIQYSYDWPGIDEEELRYSQHFCIVGSAPTVERLEVASDPGECANPARADYSDVYGENELIVGRIYVPQTQASELQDKLRDPDMDAYVIVRQRDDGKITPRELRFEPRTSE